MPDDDERPAGVAGYEAALREHEESLRVGTRVRITPGEGCHHHGEQEAGLMGVIFDVDRRGRFKLAPASTHRFHVLFDRPLWITKSTITTWYYCAAELTIVTHEEVLAEMLRTLDAPS